MRFTLVWKGFYIYQKRLYFKSKYIYKHLFLKKQKMHQSAVQLHNTKIKTQQEQMQ